MKTHLAANRESRTILVATHPRPVRAVGAPYAVLSNGAIRKVASLFNG